MTDEYASGAKRAVIPTTSPAGSVLSLSTGLELARVGIYVLDSDWRLISVDDPLRLLSAAVIPEWVGQVLWEADPSLSASEFGIALRAAVDGGITAEVRNPPDGLPRWVEVSASTRDGEVVICCRDVTADRATSDELADQTKRLHRKAALLDIARDAIYLRELDDTISYWNSGAAVLYGRTSGEAIGAAARLMLQVDPAAYDAATRVLLGTGRWSGELEQVRSDGAPWIADCRWQLGYGEGGRPSIVLCVVTDVTERKREQEAIFRSQRLDSLGTLAGGMAHDLNNILTPIMLSTQLLASDELDEGKQLLLASIEGSAVRGAEMIRQVLSFARGEESRRQLLDISLLLDQLAGFCAEILPKSIVFATEAATGLPPVLGDNTQILQILMNLITNARDAMPDGGNLTVTAERVLDPASLPTEEGTTHSVVIHVNDTGTGMSRQTLTKIFEPFYTTKAVGEGTGLGLSTSISIARAHGGEIRAVSSPGQGSQFSLHLPAALTPALFRPKDALWPDEHIVAGRGECVLIIDDESTIRAILQHTLETSGYRTLSAADGVEGIMMLENADAPVDLVLTDMMMPIMDGSAIAEYLSEHHPGVALIAASGVTDTEEDARAAHSGISHFLNKPFSTDELLHVVRRALDEIR